MVTRDRGLLVLILVLLILSLPRSARTDPRPDPTLARALGGVSGARMLADVTHLSGAEYGGRQAGTAEDLHSALFIAERFRSLGLQPAGTDPLISHSPAWGLQTLIVTWRVGPPTLELATGADQVVARAGTDYLPILDSPSVNVTAPVVFAGYGISDPARGLDEYQGLDVRNRIVFFLRGKPEGYTASITQADKQRMAREKGAVGFLVATGPVLNAYERRRGLSAAPQAAYSGAREERPVPGCWISTALAERILAPYLTRRGQSLQALQEQLNASLKPQSGPTGTIVRMTWESAQGAGAMWNVAGLLPGREPSASGTVVVGAHRDHFGRQAGLVFPGADDNASGTAVLLELARVLRDAGPFARSILFVSFSGEEGGLRGSRLYVERPVRALSGTAGMVNLDHAGVGNGRLTVGVTSLDKQVAMDAGRAAQLAERLDVFGFFPGGDHVPFTEAGVPTVTIVSGGEHPDFHQPGDTPEKVQPVILETVARYALAVTWRLAGGSRTD